MPTLLEVQTAMRCSLLGSGDAAVAPTLGDALTPADRLSVYRNTSRTALTNALRLNFPAVQRLVGKDFFAAAADAFISHNPPNTAWLDLYGDGFPEFLQSFEPATGLIIFPTSPASNAPSVVLSMPLMPNHWSIPSFYISKRPSKDACALFHIHQ